MKRLLTLTAILLIITMLPFTLFSCNKEEPSDSSSSTSASTSSSGKKDEETKLEGTEYKIVDNLDKIKINGRYTLTNRGVACDNVGSGIEFSGTMKGKVYLSVVGVVVSGETRAAYFTVYIDGVRQEERLRAKLGFKETVLTLADFGETEGEHHIRVVKQTEARYARVQFANITMDGTFGTKPADKEYLIEFVGSDLICGMGNYNGTPDQEPSVAQTAEYEDGTQAMSFLTAEHFGADCSILGVSGMGVASSWFAPLNTPKYYEANSYYRDDEVAYDFANGRTPDLIVLNIGKNDGQDLPVKPTDIEFKTTARNFLNFLRATHGKNVRIVWAYDIYDECKMSIMEDVIEELGGESAGIYICNVYSNKLGGQKHTDIEGHKKSAQDLIAFIEAKGLLSKTPAVNDTLEWDEDDIFPDEKSFVGNSRYFKYIGRATELSAGVATDHVASGVSFKGVFKGDVKLTLTCTAKRDTELFLTVYVDGVRIKDTYTNGKRSEGAFRLAAGEHTITLASFAQAGEHTITVLKQTESGYALLELKKLNFTGFITKDKPADKELYIEFIGDSLTCGMGSAGNPTETHAQGIDGADWEDGTLSYAYLTANTLDADYSIISESGMGVADTWFTAKAGAFYSAASYNRDSTTAFNFASARIPDFVVVNLGTNDHYLNTAKPERNVMARFKGEVENFIELIRTNYGANTKIVWVSGVWANINDAVSIIDQVCSELGGEAAGLYRLDVEYNDENRKGAESHPSIAGQEDVARQLTAFLTEKGLA